MGWLGWTEEQTLDTSMTSIVLAYDGRLEMLQSIFGGGETVEEDEEPPDPADVAKRLKAAIRMGAGPKPPGMK